ncbi:MAG: hypothetical protein ACYS26_14160 [Planctomycetota bacterium]
MATSWRERQAARRTQRNAARTRTQDTREREERTVEERPIENDRGFQERAPESRDFGQREYESRDFDRPAPTRFRPSRFDPADRNLEHDRRREADEREAELHGDPQAESTPEPLEPAGPRTVATLDLPKNLAMPELSLAARVVAEALEDDVEVPHRERWKLYGMDKQEGEQARPERLFLEIVRFAEGTPVLFREPVSAVDTAAERLKEIKLIDLV